MRCEVVDRDQLHDLAIVIAQHRGLGFGDDARGQRLRDLLGNVECRDFAGLRAFDADPLLDRLGGH